jgi:hypothetical protein
MVGEGGEPEGTLGNDFAEAVDGLIADAASAHQIMHAEQREHARNWQRRDEVYGGIARRASAIDERVRIIIEGHEPCA